MFFLRHKVKLIETGFFRGYTDFHSHILPAVDDGIGTLEEALETLGYFTELKVNKVILTPHVMNGVGEDREKVTRAYEMLCGQYKGGIILNLAAEYMLDSGFRERLENGLNHLEKDRVLVETSYLSPPNNLYELLYDIVMAGNTPVIAHPERYLYMSHADFHKLKDNDCLLQLNLLSLAGYHGKQALKNAEYLLEEGMYDLSGTDLHHLGTFKKWIGALKVTDKQLDRLRRLCFR